MMPATNNNTPQRVQRSRAKGSKTPPNTRYIGRPTKWGNPYRVKKPTTVLTVEQRFSLHLPLCSDRAEAVKKYEWWLGRRLAIDPTFLEPLRQYDYLSCWCPIDEPCHVDVVIKHLTRSE